MSSHQIQFQHGMAIFELLSRLGTGAQRAKAAKAARWPNVVRCPRCSADEHYVVGHGGRKLVQCNGCRLQTSVMAGRLMEHTELSLTTRLSAIHHPNSRIDELLPHRWAPR